MENTEINDMNILQLNNIAHDNVNNTNTGEYNFKYIVKINIERYKYLSQWKDFASATFYAALLDPIIAFFDPNVSNSLVISLFAILLGLTSYIEWLTDHFNYADNRLFIMGLDIFQEPLKDNNNNNITVTNIIKKYRTENIKKVAQFFIYWIVFWGVSMFCALYFSEYGFIGALKSCATPGAPLDPDKKACIGIVAVYVRFIFYSCAITITTAVFFWKLNRSIFIKGPLFIHKQTWKLFFIGIANDIINSPEYIQQIKWYNIKLEQHSVKLICDSEHYFKCN